MSADALYLTSIVDLNIIVLVGLKFTLNAVDVARTMGRSVRVVRRADMTGCCDGLMSAKGQDQWTESFMVFYVQYVR